jgi:hypothetical protein
MSDSEWDTPPGAGSEIPQAGEFVPPGMTPEQAAYQRGRRDAIRQMSTPRMTPFRVICGILWLAIAVGFGVGAIDNLASGTVGEGLVGLVIAGLAGWYDYRIWTLKARRLFFII